MALLRCTNCGMYGNKKQIKHKIGESLLTDRVYAFLLCTHCNDKDGLLCATYGGKQEMKNRNDIEELDHWELKIKPMKVK